MDFDDKVAIVTGSTKGIGRSIVESFAQAGAKVIVTSRVLRDAEKSAKNLRERGFDAVGAKLDLEQVVDPNELIQCAIGEYGRLDILVNNAITQNAASPMDELDGMQIDDVFKANITNTFLLCKYAYPHLKNSQGNIVNIASVVTNRYMLGLPFYTIIKGAVLQMTKVLAAEWGGDKVRINAINPGCTRTSVYKNLGLSSESSEAHFNYSKQFHVLKRVAESEEIANMVNFLASDKAQFITGSIFDVDGGYSIQGININPNEDSR